jgi:hypothetical protein
VIDPAMAAIRALAEQALARGELRGDGLLRFPQLLAAPAVLATLWNGLFAAGDPLDAEAMFLAWLDLACPPLPPGAPKG